MKQPSTNRICLALYTFSDTIRNYLASLESQSPLMFSQKTQGQKTNRNRYRRYTATLAESFHNVQVEILVLHKALLEADRQADFELSQYTKTVLDSLTQWESQCISLLEEIDQKLLEDREAFPQALILRNHQSILQRTAHIISLYKGDSSP